MNSISRRGAFIVLSHVVTATVYAETPTNAVNDSMIETIWNEVIAWRRDIHQHPELGNNEIRTAALIAHELTAMGLTVRTHVAETGVIALIDSGKAGPVLALRADMDALPIEEKTGLPFASRDYGVVNGNKVKVMHACGHDMHVAMLLGAAKILQARSTSFRGAIKLIFQPAEEGLPGLKSGAEKMIEAGVLANPKVDAIIGMHVGITNAASGVLSWRSNGIMAGGDTFEIVVNGKQTHGALPWEGKDPIVVSAQMILALQTIVSRQINLTQAPAVLTIGTIHAGQRTNIVPESARLTGTIRTLDPSLREQLLTRVKHTAEYIAKAADTNADVKFEPGYPVNWNDPVLVRRLSATLKKSANQGFDENVTPSTTSEDFAFYAQHVPSLFFFLGVKPANRTTSSTNDVTNHSPYFDPDEAAMRTGINALVNVATDFLKNEP